MVTNNAADFHNPLLVTEGGTQLASTTAYAVMCAGTTSTAALQQVSGVGTLGQVLTSQGASALPQWGAAPVQTFQYVTSATASSSAFLSFSLGSFIFLQFRLVGISLQNADSLYIQGSADGGSTWQTTNYISALLVFDDSTTVNFGTNPDVGGLIHPAATASTFTNGIVDYILDSGDPNIAVNSWTSFTDATGAPKTALGCRGVTVGASSFNTVRFIASTGTILAGTIYQYGILNS